MPKLPKEFLSTTRVPLGHEAMRPRPCGILLEILSGADAGKRIPFALHSGERRTDRVTVGRRDCDIMLVDRSIGRRHFELCIAAGEVWVRDLGSTNGLCSTDGVTFKEGQLIVGSEFLAGACRFRLAKLDTVEEPVSSHTRQGGMVGESEAARAMFSIVERIAKAPLSVLLMGESGTGKGETARAIHTASGAKGKFVTLDCASLQRELASGLIYGHKKGAFSGAVSDHAGPFEVAENGTVFVDEVGELPLELQPAFLRALDRKEVQRVGEEVARPVNVRVIAATNRDLQAEVAAKRFREDLYFRLQQLELVLPPLRQKTDDVLPLADHFLGTVGCKLPITAEAKDALKRYRWPGNVRELRNVMERAAYLNNGHEIGVADLRLGRGVAVMRDEGAPRRTLSDELDRCRHQYCERALRATNGHVGEAAKIADRSEKGFRNIARAVGLLGERAPSQPNAVPGFLDPTLAAEIIARLKLQSPARVVDFLARFGVAKVRELLVADGEAAQRKLDEWERDGGNGWVDPFS